MTMATKEEIQAAKLKMIQEAIEKVRKMKEKKKRRGERLKVRKDEAK
jgi:hypothetical protein